MRHKCTRNQSSISFSFFISCVGCLVLHAGAGPGRGGDQRTVLANDFGCAQTGQHGLCDSPAMDTWIEWTVEEGSVSRRTVQARWVDGVLFWLKSQAAGLTRIH